MTSSERQRGGFSSSCLLVGGCGTGSTAPWFSTLLLMVKRGERHLRTKHGRSQCRGPYFWLLAARPCFAGLECRAGRDAVRMPAARCHCRSRQRKVGPAGSGTARREPQGRRSCSVPLRVPDPFQWARKGWFSQYFVLCFAFRQQKPVTTLGGAADSLGGRQALQRDLENRGLGNRQLHKGQQGWLLHLGGAQSSPTGRDLKVLFDSKLNTK